MRFLTNRTIYIPNSFRIQMKLLRSVRKWGLTRNHRVASCGKIYGRMGNYPIKLVSSSWCIRQLFFL